MDAAQVLPLAVCFFLVGVGVTIDVGLVLIAGWGEDSGESRARLLLVQTTMTVMPPTLLEASS